MRACSRPDWRNEKRKVVFLGEVVKEEVYNLQVIVVVLHRKGGRLMLACRVQMMMEIRSISKHVVVNSRTRGEIIDHGLHNNTKGGQSQADVICT